MRRLISTVIVACFLMLAGGFAGSFVESARPPECAVTELRGDSECGWLVEITSSSVDWCYDCGDGLWIPEAELCSVSGDFDGDFDGDVDLADYAMFQNSMTGP